MKTFDELQFAICRLQSYELSKLKAWIDNLEGPDLWSVQEASTALRPNAALVTVQRAIESLAPDQFAELRDWLRLVDTESVAMLAAVDDGISSLEEQGGVELDREELEARVRQWAGVSS
jgi:hypothetical protein